MKNTIKFFMVFCLAVVCSLFFVACDGDAEVADVSMDSSSCNIETEQKLEENIEGGHEEDSHEEDGHEDGGHEEGNHEHELSYVSDDMYHWLSCDCGYQTEKVAHQFEEIVEDDNFAEGATCSHGAMHYKVCECGHLSTETFESGAPIEHTYNGLTGKCVVCEQTRAVVIDNPLGSSMTYTSGNVAVGNLQDTIFEINLGNYAGCVQFEILGSLGGATMSLSSFENLALYSDSGSAIPCAIVYDRVYNCFTEFSLNSKVYLHIRKAKSENVKLKISRVNYPEVTPHTPFTVSMASSNYCVLYKFENNMGAKTFGLDVKSGGADYSGYSWMLYDASGVAIGSLNKQDKSVGGNGTYYLAVRNSGTKNSLTITLYNAFKMQISSAEYQGARTMVISGICQGNAIVGDVLKIHNIEGDIIGATVQNVQEIDGQTTLSVVLASVDYLINGFITAYDENDDIFGLFQEIGIGDGEEIEIDEAGIYYFCADLEEYTDDCMAEYDISISGGDNYFNIFEEYEGDIYLICDDQVDGDQAILNDFQAYYTGRFYFVVVVEDAGDGVVFSILEM